MVTAATGDADGGRVALAARCATDLATLGWVRAALLGQLGGVMPPVPPPLIGPAGYLDRRTAASLHRRPVTPRLHQAGSL
jgi:hypothetical protein